MKACNAAAIAERRCVADEATLAGNCPNRLTNMIQAVTAEQVLGVAEVSPSSKRGAAVRLAVIGLISFLTLVDLFAAQAILPTLVRTYSTTPAMMGFAVNASTIGMAIAGVAVALISRHLNRRRGIWVSLAMLAIPTSLLASAPDITGFMILRVVQGLCMSTAFTLTMAHLAEQSGAEDTASALAAYITGNVASNLFGRVLSATVTEYLGLHANFYIFAVLNLTGAALVYFGLKQTTSMPVMTKTMGSTLTVLREHLRNSALLSSFAIGFLILFAFIGTFTYVNFILARPPISLSPMSLGLVYFVFVPAILTTPFAGYLVKRLGSRLPFWGASMIALAGLPLLLSENLGSILGGLVLVGAGTFFAQAVATGFVSRAASADRAAASGIYLSCYYFGGVAGSALLGRAFEHYGWTACVAAIGVALMLCIALASIMKITNGNPSRLAGGITADEKNIVGLVQPCLATADVQPIDGLLRR
jgi:MFS transporter, YNFM family, putative membrane transport protein